MRITNNQINKKTAEALDVIGQSWLSVSEDITLTRDYIQDIYSLFAAPRGRGKREVFKKFWQLFLDVKSLYISGKTPSLRKTLDFYMTIKQFMYGLTTSLYFQELDKLDALEATEAFLNLFNNRQMQNRANPQQQDMDGASLSPDAVPVDMDAFDSSIGAIDSLIESGIFDEEDFNEIIARSAGIGHNKVDVKNINDVVHKLGNRMDRELSIFKVARNHEETEIYEVGEEVTDSPTPENDMTITNNKSISDWVRLLPTEHLHDDDLLTYKLMNREASIIQHQDRRKKKQALYLLVDVSGSMDGLPSVYAAGVALSLVRQAYKEGATYFLRFFDGSPHEVRQVKTKQEFLNIAEVLVRQPFSGGGTDFDRAIMAAVHDIKADPVGFEKAEIMLITDGQDRFTHKKDDLENIKLHTVQVGDGGYERENGYLKEVSETFNYLTRRDMQNYLNS